ncbi:uncharacterized protein [Bemisia tabaci]|uniref:uncharacterized protein n=1 Tax=Bemisia tabaci TaxID=7038 RepID=UPI003B28D05D
MIKKPVVKNQVSGHVNAGFWACITLDGVMALVETTPRMDAPEYCSILKEGLVPHKRAMFGVETRGPFVHDSVPTHTANLTREWMHIHEAEIDLRVHPPYSPDVNPIENVRAKMVNEWDCRKEKTRPAFQVHVREVWSNLGNDPGCVSNH